MGLRILIERMLKRLFIVSLFFVFYPIAFSDIVILKDNTVLRGSIVSKEGEVIFFKLSSGRVIRLKSQNVAVIEFGSNKVVEFLEDGKKVRGVVIGQSQEGVIIKTTLGERVVKKEYLKEYSEQDNREEIFITNYYTNFVTNLVYETNIFFITNYLTNYNHELGELYCNVNEKSFIDYSLTNYFSFGLGFFYNSEYVFLLYYGGFCFKVDRLVFEVNVGSFGNLFASLGVGYDVFSWLCVGSKVGGFWGDNSGYLFSVYVSPHFSFLRGGFYLPVSLVFVNFKPALIFDLEYKLRF